MLLCLFAAGCRDVRVEGDDVADAAREGEEVAPPGHDQATPRAPRSCDVGAPIVQETFAGGDWPAAWLTVGLGESWVEGAFGFLRAEVGASHGRTIHAPFGDIDVAVRFRSSADQALHVILRGDVENKPAIVVEGHRVGSSNRARWLRARVWDELGTTRLEVHEWFDGEPEPQGWLGSVVDVAEPVGTFALLASEHDGQLPVRIEEILICPLATSTDA